ncbi:unnamed protein product [Boreogadus saida]
MSYNNTVTKETVIDLGPDWESWFQRTIAKRLAPPSPHDGYSDGSTWSEKTSDSSLFITSHDINTFPTRLVHRGPLRTRSARVGARRTTVLMRLTFVANSNRPEFSYDYKAFGEQSAEPSPHGPKGDVDVEP